jgi:uncharacterized damage-inducible protein DinB
MTLVEAILEDLEVELKMTRSILEAVPNDRAAWTPHPKSMPLGKLAMHIAVLPAFITICLTTPDFNFAKQGSPEPVFQSREGLLAFFDKNAEGARSSLAKATEEDLAHLWTLSAGERVITESPRSLVLLHTCLGHMIHHRAQLGVYLRLLDLPVPGVYGPSADDKAHHAG